MASHEYHFITEWQVPGSIETVYAILDAAEALPRWWPSVYLDVRVVRPGDERGVGKVVALWTKGWLPYTLRWSLEKLDDHPPHGFSLKAMGDFNGTGRWTLVQAGPVAIITYDWRISADKWLLRHLSFAMKPLFAANHRWAMARGEESLKLELLRRQAATPAAAARLPAPPPPTFPHNRLRRRA